MSSIYKWNENFSSLIELLTNFFLVYITQNVFKRQYSPHRQLLAYYL